MENGLILLIMVYCLAGLVGIGLWLWTIVDILKSEFIGSNKIIWLLISIFIPGLGVILYFLIGRGQKIKTPAANVQMQVQNS